MTTGHVPIGEYRQRFFSHLPLAVYVVTLKFKPKNTSSWNATCMTPPHNHATPLFIASSTSLQTTLEHLALITDKVPLQCDSLE